MVRRLKDKPEIFNRVFHEQDYYWEGSNDQGAYGYMCAKKDRDRATLHLEIIPERLTLSVFKEFQSDWDHIKAELKRDGVKILIACCPAENIRAQRVWVRFGFPIPEIMAISHMGV
jgi:hypothetical protein